MSSNPSQYNFNELNRELQETVQVSLSKTTNVRKHNIFTIFILSTVDNPIWLLRIEFPIFGRNLEKKYFSFIKFHIFGVFCLQVDLKGDNIALK